MEGVWLSGNTERSEVRYFNSFMVILGESVLYLCFMVCWTSVAFMFDVLCLCLTSCVRVLCVCVWWCVGRIVLPQLFFYLSEFLFQTLGLCRTFEMEGVLRR